ncbi:hypothetical protein AAC387_Pa03g0906 [Persea americana]
MAERNTQSIGSASRRTIFCVITSITFLLISSLSFFLHCSSHPYFINNSLLPSPKIFAVIDTENPSFHYQNTSHPSIHGGGISIEENLSNCNPKKALKVFMYDLPPIFHFGLVGWKSKSRCVWPDILSEVPEYAGGLNLQHSIEYWLTLDLLSSRYPNRPGPCNAIRVDNSREADVIFVPFFASLSVNRYSKVIQFQNMSTNKFLQAKLVEFLTAQEEWKGSGGRDHVIVAHHPNSMQDARRMLWPAMFILADFGRYPPSIANVEKDVIAPYRHVINRFVNDTLGFDSRPTLLYFQGAIYRKDGGIFRQELFYLLKDEKDVHFSFGTAKGDGVNKASQGMHSSKFCLNIAGDTPSSNRLFDAIASHCVPVIVSDEIELPFEDVIDYSEFCIFVRTADAIKEGFLINLIRSIGRDEWTHMWRRLKEIEHHFEFHYPSQKDDAVQMIWQAVARKASAIRLKVHKSRRFSWYDTTNDRPKPFTLPKEFDL